MDTVTEVTVRKVVAGQVESADSGRVAMGGWVRQPTTTHDDPAMTANVGWEDMAASMRLRTSTPDDRAVKVNESAALVATEASTQERTNTRDHRAEGETVDQAAMEVCNNRTKTGLRSCDRPAWSARERIDGAGTGKLAAEEPTTTVPAASASKTCCSTFGRTGTS
jgi:hypothetical protein